MRPAPEILASICSCSIAKLHAVCPRCLWEMLEHKPLEKLAEVKTRKCRCESPPLLGELFIDIASWDLHMLLYATMQARLVTQLGVDGILSGLLVPCFLVFVDLSRKSTIV